MTADLLAVTASAIFLGLAFMSWAAMPSRDRTPANLATLGCIVAGTLLAYNAPSLIWFVAGWCITIIPYWIWIPRGPKFALAGSTAALIAGWALHFAQDTNLQRAAFAAFMLAALWRKGTFPFHSWVPRSMDDGPSLPLGLLLNGHLALFLVLRFAIPLLPNVAGLAFPLMSDLALFTALYSAVVAVAETRTLRILGFLSVSQASFLLAGLENRNTEGITGALVHWMVVAVATTGLLCICRALEARYPKVAAPQGYLGLVSHAPRFAAFFALCGLALVGLPGTLGFAAEDLLFHGSLESHPWLGITLPLATALNGITVYRLFSRIFLGRAAKQSPAIADARPAERWALTGAVLFLVIGGIIPGVLVAVRTPAAERAAALLGGQ